MKLFLIKQDVNNDYNTYDAAVVCASNEEDAKSIHPSDGKEVPDIHGIDREYGTWSGKKDVSAEYIGEASANVIRGVICSSFNAG